MRVKGGVAAMHKNRMEWPWMPTVLLGIGGVATAVILWLRAYRMPLLQDAATGRLSENMPATVALLVTVLLLVLGGYFTTRERVDVPSSHALLTALACMAAGGVLSLSSVYDMVLWFGRGVLPAPAQAAVAMLPLAVACGMLVSGAVGGVVLVRLGLQILSEGGTRRGMSTLAMLAPVVWAWCRLAWYELSYAASVGWSEKLYDFAMVIFQLLFLFKLARLASGIGKAGFGTLLALALGTAVTGLSGSLLRVYLYFTADAEVYAAGALVGLSDFGIGLLGLAVAIALWQGYRQTNRL